MHVRHTIAAELTLSFLKRTDVTELTGMYFKSIRIHLRCELFWLCDKDGACRGQGSELNSRECFLSIRIHLRCELFGLCDKDGPCKGVRVRAELIGCNKNIRIRVSCELLAL